MAFASAPLEDRELVDLSVVAAGLFLKEVVSEPLRLEVARNAEGVRAVSFLNSVCDAGVLREITECVSNLNSECLARSRSKNVQRMTPMKVSA